MGKDDKSSSERNPSMIAGFRKILEKTDGEISGTIIQIEVYVCDCCSA